MINSAVLPFRLLQGRTPPLPDGEPEEDNVAASHPTDNNYLSQHVLLNPSRPADGRRKRLLRAEFDRKPAGSLNIEAVGVMSLVNGDTVVGEGRDVMTGERVKLVVSPNQRLRVLAAAHLTRGVQRCAHGRGAAPRGGRAAVIASW
jgi:hypothetical protein